MLRAWPGQWLRQRWQEPHESVQGESASRGRVVRISARKKREPAPGIIS